MGLADGLAMGATGAVTVAVLDGALTRIPSLNGHPALRAAARLIAAGSIAYGADALGAPSFVADGVVSGAVLVTILDIGVSLIGRQRRMEPPAAKMGALGAPWAPSPRYGLLTR